jgi:hypothetical protein
MTPEDVFRGIVVKTVTGLRFVDRDQVEQLTTAQVSCALSDEQAADLPEPPAPAPDAGMALRQSQGQYGVVAIVRCSRGGLFETVWIPLVSFKAIRLGPFRIQRCPVHDRVELVRRVDPDTLSSKERAAAARYPAGRIP